MKTNPSNLLGCALLGFASLTAAAEIDVMTQNQYLGADLAPVLAAAIAPVPDLAAFNAAVVDALKQIATNRPAERVRALADQIADRRPDVVGLQEAYAFSCMTFVPDPAPAGKGCEDPEIQGAFTDHLQGTVDALRGRYVLAGKVTDINLPPIPFNINGFWAVLSVADRDAILVRRGLRAGPVDFGSLGLCPKPSDQGCNYVTAPKPFVTPIGPIAIERGFLAVDVRVKGRDYRVFNTHLEQRELAPGLTQTRLLQVGQASELLNMVFHSLPSHGKVVVVGDFNSSPVDTIASGEPTPYQIFAGSGFTDVWALRPQRGDGFTCCQAEDLSNRKSQLSERIDLIFSLAPPARVSDLELIGERFFDKTRSRGRGGLWPSDHASLAAELHFH